MHAEQLARLRPAIAVLLAGGLGLVSCGNDSGLTSSPSSITTDADSTSPTEDETAANRAEATGADDEGTGDTADDEETGETANDEGTGDTANGEGTGDTANEPSTDSEITGSAGSNGDGPSRNSGDNDPTDSSSATPAREALGDSAIASAFNEDDQATSGSYKATISATVDGRLLEDAFQQTGSFDRLAGSFEIELDMSGFASADSAEGLAADEAAWSVIHLSERSYLRWAVFQRFGVPAGSWLEVDPEEADEMISIGEAFGVESATAPLLVALRDSAAQVVEVGVESMHGVDTTHFQATVFPHEVVSNTLSSSQQAVRENSFGSVDELSLEIWMDDRGYVHRMTIQMEVVDPVRGPGEALFDLEVFDHDEAVIIEAPDPSIVAQGEDFGIGSSSED